MRSPLIRAGLHAVCRPEMGENCMYFAFILLGLPLLVLALDHFVFSRKNPHWQLRPAAR
jgi:hypothetical protein